MASFAVGGFARMTSVDLVETKKNYLFQNMSVRSLGKVNSVKLYDGVPCSVFAMPPLSELFFSYFSTYLTGDILLSSYQCIMILVSFSILSKSYIWLSKVAIRTTVR